MKLENLIKKYLIKCELQNNLDPKTLKAYRLDLKHPKIFLSSLSQNCILGITKQERTEHNVSNTNFRRRSKYS